MSLLFPASGSGPFLPTRLLLWLAVCRLAADPGSLDLTFQPALGSATAWVQVNALMRRADGRLIVGGAFGLQSETGPVGLARLLADGRGDPEFRPDPALNRAVESLLPDSEGRLVLGLGDPFSDGVAVPRLARLLPEGALDPSFDPGTGPDHTVFALAWLPDGRLLAGGTFTNVSGAPQRALAVFRSDGTHDTTFDSPYADKEIAIRALLPLTDGRVLAGGTHPFFVYPVPDNHAPLLLLGRDGTVDAAYQPQLPERTHVLCLAAAADGIWVGGAEYRLPDHVYRPVLRKLDLSGRVQLDLSPAFAGSIGFLKALVVRPDASLLAGLTSGGPYFLRLFDAQGQPHPDVDRHTLNMGSVQALALDTDQRLYVGGSAFLQSGVWTYGVNRVLLDDTPVPGLLVLEPQAVVPREGDRQARVTVRRLVGADGPVSVTYRTRSATAIAGEDFVPVAGRIEFADGDTEQTVVIELVDDPVYEPTETFQVELDEPAGGAIVSQPGSLEVAIEDDDALVEFEEGRYAASELVPAVYVMVVRRGRLDQDHAVSFATRAGSATPGTDFDPQTGTLAFPPGVERREIVFPIHDDALREGVETFEISLSDPSGTVPLGLTNATVEILDNDRPGGLVPPAEWPLDSRVVQVLVPAGDGGVWVGGDLGPMANPTLAIRLTAEGRPDPQFVLDLKPAIGAASTLGWKATALAPLDSGRLLLALSSGYVLQVRANGEAVSHSVLRTDGTVRTIALLEDGAAILGGEFTNAGGLAQSNMVRLDARGAIDPEFAQRAAPDGPVRVAMDAGSGSVFIAGDFTRAGGVARGRLARLDAGGRVDPAFAPRQGANGPIHAALRLPEHRWLVGGDFTEFDGQPRSRLARLRPDGTLDESWVPAEVTLGVVHAIAPEPEGGWFIAGTFRTVAGAPQVGLARLNPDGALDPVFPVEPRLTAVPVNALVPLDNGDLLVGGAFTFVGPTKVGGLARFCGRRLDGHSYLAFRLDRGLLSEGLGPYPLSVVRSGDTNRAATAVVTTRDGSAQAVEDYLAVAQPLTFLPGELERVVVVNVRGDTLREGKEHFSAVLTEPDAKTFLARAEARLEILDDDTPGSVDRSLGLRLPAGSEIRALVTQADGRIVLAGRLPNLPRPILRLHPDGRVDESFSVSEPFPPANSLIQAVAVQDDGRLLIAGTFGKAMGRTNHLARLLPDGRFDSTFSTPIAYRAGDSNALTIVAVEAGGTILAGGLSSMGLLPAEGPATLYNASLIRLHRDGTLAAVPAFNDYSTTTPRYDHRVPIAMARTVLPLADRRFLVGGRFRPFKAGQSTGGISRIHPDGSPDPTFDLAATGDCAWLAEGPADTVYAAGSFVTAWDGTPFGLADGSISGEPLGSLLRLDPQGRPDPTFRPAFDGPVHVCTRLRDERVLAGGAFHTVNGATHHGLVLLEPDGSVAAGFSVGDGLDGALAALAGTADGKVLLGGGFDSVDRVPSTGLARLHLESAPGALEFTAPLFLARESQTQAFVAVRRVGGSAGEVTARVRTRDGTARTGVHYEAVDALVRFGPGELNPVQVPVQLRTNSVFEGNLVLDLDLTELSGGATAGLIATARVRLEDSLTLQRDSGFRASLDAVAQDAVLLDDGRVAVVGRFTGGVALLRRDGTRDPGFVSPARNGVSGTAALLQPDGKLLVLGSGGYFQSNDGTRRTNLARLELDGTVDPAFNAGTAAVGLEYGRLLRQPDGKLLVGGATRLTRLLADGSPDPEFRTTNKAMRPYAVDPTGRILVAGGFYWDAPPYPGSGASSPVRLFNVARLLDDGTFDAGFRASAYLAPRNQPNEQGQVTALAIDDQGRVLIAGTFAYVNGVRRRGLARLFPDGALDETFSPGDYTFPEALLPLDDRTMLVGSSSTRSDLVRLLPSGLADLEFKTSLGNLRGLTVDPRGAVYAAGDWVGLPTRGVARLHWAPNQPSTVRLETPAPIEVEPGQPFVLHTEPSDPDDVVTLVKAVVGDRTLATSDRPPWDLIVKLLEPGDHPLELVAEDVFGRPSAPVSVRVTVLPPFEARFTELTVTAGTAVELGVIANRAAEVVLESSTDLTDWQILSTHEIGPLPRRLTDPRPFEGVCRFYRLRQDPAPRLRPSAGPE